MALNVFTFAGNLGKDADQKHTAGGDSIVSFSVPVKSGYGEKATTSWIRCSMFGKRGESVLPYLVKGQLVGVSGEFSAREWTNKEGVLQTSCEVRVNDLTLLGAKSEGSTAKAPPPKSTGGSAADMTDDIPF